MIKLSFAIIALIPVLTTALGDNNPPCPLLGPNFPLPTSLSSAPAVQVGIKDLQDQLKSSIDTGNSSFGVTTPNTTSFSIALFSTENDRSIPYLWQYHHTAPALSNSTSGVKIVDENSIYRLGTVTQLFTVYTFLVEASERHWDKPVTKWVPELNQASNILDAKKHPLDYVDWESVTLGDLAGHLAGIARDYAIGDISRSDLNLAEHGFPPLSRDQVPSCGIGNPCTRQEFFAGFTHRSPVELPGTTPSFSNAAFQILAYALEGITGKSFEKMLNDSILHPLGLGHTYLSSTPRSTTGVIPRNAGWGVLYGEDPALSMYSSLHDLTLTGISILSSSLLSAAQTRQWLRPISQTSNIANSQGRPWEIYNEVAGVGSPVTEIFTVMGSIGSYSSYIGVVPNYGVGFAMLAADTDASADLNPYVDFIATFILPALEKTAIVQSISTYAGSYSANGTANSTMTIQVDGSPGLLVKAMVINGIDFKSVIGELKGIRPSALIFRLYPTNLQTKGQGAFRAIWQDGDDIADAGTPTCVSWMDVENLVYGGVSLDEFVFELDVSGRAKAIKVPALRIVLERD